MVMTPPVPNDILYSAVQKIFSAFAQTSRFTITLHLEKLTLIPEFVYETLGNKPLYYSQRKNISIEAFVIEKSIS